MKLFLGISVSLSATRAPVSPGRPPPRHPVAVMLCDISFVINKGRITGDKQHC